MRTIYLFLLVCLITSSGFTQTRKELRKEKKLAEFEEIKKLIQSKDFVFDAENVNPQRGGTISLMSHPNTLIIRNDSVLCDLPFFGTGYYIIPGERGGLHFEEKLENWIIRENNKKLSLVLTLEARKTTDWYKCTFNIQGGGSTTLTITSQNRSTISFWGDIRKSEPVKTD